jgi:Skp family chaperone for outer membrane proteins
MGDNQRRLRQDGIVQFQLWNQVLDVIPDRRRFAINLLFILATALAAATPDLVAAQQEDGTVIAILDMERILRESKAAKNLREEIDSQRQAHQATLREQENALRAADQELARQRAVLSAEAFAAKRKELQEQAIGLQQELLSRQKEIEELFGRGINQVRNALAEVAKEIADERGISLILLKATIVLASRDLDITEEALQRLDERLPAVTLAKESN